jgi:hypothetical protein
MVYLPYEHPFGAVSVEEADHLGRWAASSIFVFRNIL